MKCLLVSIVYMIFGGVFVNTLPSTPSKDQEGKEHLSNQYISFYIKIVMFNGINLNCFPKGLLGFLCSSTDFHCA